MEIFLTLVDELHFARTADRLHVSSALISQTIKRLERRFGVELFERTSRRVAITPAGQQLYDELKPHYSGMRAAVDRVIAAARGVTGTLTVGFMGIMNGNIAHAADEICRASMPGVDIRVVETPLAMHTDQLYTGEADIVLIPLPIHGPDLTVGPVLVRDALHLAISSGHPIARQTRVYREDLAGMTFAAPPSRLPAYWIDHFHPRTTPSGAKIHRAARSVATYHELLSHVAANKSIAVGGGWELRTYYARPDIAYIPFADVPPIEHALVWRGAGDDRVRAFAEAAVLVARGAPYDAAKRGLTPA